MFSFLQQNSLMTLRHPPLAMHTPQEERKCSVSFLGKPWQYLLPFSVSVNPFFATWVGKI